MSSRSSSHLGPETGRSSVISCRKASQIPHLKPSTLLQVRDPLQFLAQYFVPEDLPRRLDKLWRLLQVVFAKSGCEPRNVWMPTSTSSSLRAAPLLRPWIFCWHGRAWISTGLQDFRILQAMISAAKVAHSPDMFLASMLASLGSGSPTGPGPLRLAATMASEPNHDFLLYR